MMQQGIMSKLDELRNMSAGQPQPAPAAPPMAMPAPDLMQDQAPEMVQAEQSVDAGQDAQMLADAVIKRSQGNPETALQIIEGAKGVIMQFISGSQREPQMMSTGGAPKPLKENPKTGEQEELANKNRFREFADLLRQEMAARNEINEEFPLSAYLDIITRGGKALSDEDAQMLYEMGIRSGEIGSRTNPDPLDSLPKRKPMVSMMEKGGPLKPIPEGNKGLAKLPEEVRNNMGFMAAGGELTTALNRLNYLRGN